MIPLRLASNSNSGSGKRETRDEPIGTGPAGSVVSRIPSWDHHGNWPGLFRRRIAWDDGVIWEPADAGEVAFPMNRCCRTGEDVGARAASVGKGRGRCSALVHALSTLAVGRRSVRRTRPHRHRLALGAGRPYSRRPFAVKVLRVRDECSRGDEESHRRNRAFAAAGDGVVLRAARNVARCRRRSEPARIRRSRLWRARARSGHSDAACGSSAARCA